MSDRKLVLKSGLVMLAMSVNLAAFAAEPEDVKDNRTGIEPGTVRVSPDGKFTRLETKPFVKSATAGDAKKSAVVSSETVPSKTSSAETAAAETASVAPTEEELKATAAAAYAEREGKRRAAALQAETLHNEAIDHFDLARIYLGQWNAEMAEIELQASIMCEPAVKAFHRDYVLVALMRGNPMKALAEAMMVVGMGEAVPMSDAQKDKLKETACKAHYVKGIAAARESKWTDAITEFQWALTYQPNNARVSRSMAFAYASTGDFTKAEKEYAASFAMDPSDAFAHADLAFLLEKAGNTTKAMEQLEQAVKLQPDVAALHVDLAWLAESKGDLNRASAEFEEAVKLSPKHAALWTHLGKLFARQGRSERAIEAYKAALNLDPEQQDAEQGLHSLETVKPNANKA